VNIAFSETLASATGNGWPGARTSRRRRCSAAVGFLPNGNMLVGVWKDSLIVRLGLDNYDHQTSFLAFSV